MDRHLQDPDDEEQRDDTEEMFIESAKGSSVRDTDAISLFDELKNLSTILLDNVTSSLDVLGLIHATRLY